jgi:hypothetical protein
MIKKIVKVVLVLLMVVGAVIAASNMIDLELHAAGKWVKYLPDEPDCRGEGNTCYDFTAPTG